MVIRQPNQDKKSSKRKYLIIALSIFALLSLIYLISNPDGARSTDLDEENENDDDIPSEANIVPISSTDPSYNSTDSATIEDFDSGSEESSSDNPNTGYFANEDQDDSSEP